jgi:hypothetical protein
VSEICQHLHKLTHGLKIYGYPYDPIDIPLNGIYILFEKDELAHGRNRIVRIGTHTGIDQLRKRLAQHFIKENKDRSIFRKNIGRAMLNQDHDPFLEFWELDLTTREIRNKYSGKIDLSKQKMIERQVTDYIQKNFSFVVVEIPEKEKRKVYEARMISTVAQCQDCKPSPGWLGLHSTKQKIREGGLWNVNELNNDPLDGDDLGFLFGD